MEGIYYELNPYTMCRTCLGQQVGMLDLVTVTDRQKNLLEMLIIIAGFEVQLGGNLPFFLCELCEGKIEAGYYFREQCRKNNDLMQQYIFSEPSRKPVESEQCDVPAVDETEELFSGNESCESDRDSIVEDPNCEAEVDKINIASRSRKPTERLQQFPYDEVARAIEETRRPFFENVKCFKCGFMSVNARTLSLHMSHIHKDLKGKWCSKCNQEFESLSEHSLEHENNPLRCKFCEQTFISKTHLIQHLQSHSDVRPFKCDVCSKTFHFARYLKVHLRIHSNERSYKCNHCDKSFVQYNSLRCHIKRHGAEQTICTKCRQTFDSSDGYINHECDGPQGRNSAAIITSVPQNYCDVCNKKVRSLKTHIRQVHSIEGDEASDTLPTGKLCMECGKQFKTNSKLKIHMRVHTGEAPYKCSFCEKRVSTRNHLVLHERTHTGEKPHVCCVCGKGFAQSSVLNTHMRLHTGRPEVCMICKKRFCRPTELKLHMRKHTGEKPYLCVECGQSFVQRSHLMEHTKTHSDDRPFKCHFCGRGFKQNSSLKTHVQIHMGHKPYRCTHCSYACRQSYSLTQHMKQHLEDVPRPEKPHACPVCNRAFTTMAVMNSHMNTAHDMWYSSTNVENVNDDMYSKKINVI